MIGLRILFIFIWKIIWYLINWFSFWSVQLILFYLNRYFLIFYITYSKYEIITFEVVSRWSFQQNGIFALQAWTLFNSCIFLLNNISFLYIARTNFLLNKSSITYYINVIDTKYDIQIANKIKFFYLYTVVFFWSQKKTIILGENIYSFQVFTNIFKHTSVSIRIIFQLKKYCGIQNSKLFSFNNIKFELNLHWKH